MSTSTVSTVSNIAIVDVATAQEMVERAVRQALTDMAQRLIEMQDQLDSQNNHIQILEMQLQQQQENGLQVSNKSSKKTTKTDVKERASKAEKARPLTLAQLKTKAKELGLTDRQIKTFGSRTRRETWENAIAWIQAPSEVEPSERGLPVSQVSNKATKEKEVKELSNLNPYSEVTVNALLESMIPVPVSSTSITPTVQEIDDTDPF